MTKRNNLVNEARWQPQAKKEGCYPNKRGSWLVFTDSQGVGQALVQHLEAEGEYCIQISPGQTYQALKGEQWYWLNPAHCQDFYSLFQELRAGHYPPCQGALYLWGLDALPPEEISSNAPESGLGLTTLMHIILGLHRCGWSELPRLWVVTRGVQRIGSQSAEIPSAQSLLWELAREIATPEHQKLWGGIVDLDPFAPRDETSLLFAEIWQPDGEDQIAFRQGQRYVPLLVATSRSQTSDA